MVERDSPGAAPAPFSIRATAADGRSRIIAVDPATAQRLPLRSGPEWASLGADVLAAEQAGAADRAALALRRSAQ